MIVRIGLMGAIAVAIASCGSTGTAPASSSLSIAVAPGNVVIEQGDETLVTAVVTCTDGCSTAPTVTVSGLPSGMTDSVGIATANGTEVNVTVRIALDYPTALIGSYSLTLHASVPGTSTAVASPLSISVVARSGDDPYALAVNPDSASISPGVPDLLSVFVTRGGAAYQGAVALTVDGTSPGFSAAIAPASVTAASALIAPPRLSVTAPAGTAAGHYTVTVRGAAPGHTDVVTIVPVTVTSP